MNTKHQAHKPVKNATTGTQFSKRNGKEGLRQRAKFRGDSSNRRRDMAIFRLFKMAAAAIWDFSNLKFLTAQEGPTASPCKICSKLVKSRPRYDYFFYRFFQDGGRPPSWICYVCSDHPRREFGGLYHCAKFGWNRCSIFDNRHVFRFHEFGLKTPIHAPKIGVLGIFPLNGEQCQRNPKRHILARVRVV